MANKLTVANPVPSPMSTEQAGELLAEALAWLDDDEVTAGETGPVSLEKDEILQLSNELLHLFLLRACHERVREANDGDDIAPETRGSR